MPDETELSCALLLGDAEEVAYLVGETTEEKLITIRTWPIWHLRHQETREIEEAVSANRDPDSVDTGQS
jgi:hypothetical protein